MKLITTLSILALAAVLYGATAYLGDSEDPVRNKPVVLVPGGPSNKEEKPDVTIRESSNMASMSRGPTPEFSSTIFDGGLKATGTVSSEDPQKLIMTFEWIKPDKSWISGGFSGVNVEMVGKKSQDSFSFREDIALSRDFLEMKAYIQTHEITIKPFFDYNQIKVGFGRNSFTIQGWTPLTDGALQGAVSPLDPSGR